MISQAAQESGLFGDGFGLGTILLMVGMVVSVAVVSGLGFIARLNDRKSQRLALQARAARESARPPGTSGGPDENPGPRVT